MFRNPREQSSLKVDKGVLPSAGRPPTPPPSRRTAKPNESQYLSSSKSSSALSNASSSPISVLGKQSAAKTNGARKPAFKQNQSILNFFGKTSVPSTTQDDSLFFKDPANQESPINPQNNSTRRDGIADFVETKVEEPESRYNEIDIPVKRRKIGANHLDLVVRTPSPECGIRVVEERPIPDANVMEPLPKQRRTKQVRHRGGFIDDSEEEDSEESGEEEEGEEEDDDEPIQVSVEIDGRISTLEDVSAEGHNGDPNEKQISSADPMIEDFAENESYNPLIPSLGYEETSVTIRGEFGDDEDFENDEFFEGGEEFMERRWMEEQQAMEMAFDEDSKSESGDAPMTPKDEMIQYAEAREAESACPICSGSLRNLSEAQASSHVNACLDGNGDPLPAVESVPVQTNLSTQNEQSSIKPTSSEKPMSKRFLRATLPRPGQSNPFTLVKDERSSKGSAFARLMSGNAEDAAWAEAASNEVESRGKPAYQRTCPFYKIMPGLYICVDAFRYGKVEGQNAYFLSHFHSDHYIGLTSSWSHGPIFASRVTTNLIRQQLRVDEKWLVALDFEEKVEVPGTKGVHVTMIPANHCPGSSLFLFEKVVGKNKDGSPKLNRILHCGDFRACPAHLSHPLLKPEIVDAISGQTKHQNIDICYLDTTYLTPKYSFPGQWDVIDACAQMCVSLSKEIVDCNDSWEKAKLEGAGSTMTKFLEKADDSGQKEKVDELEAKNQKARGKLLVVVGTYSIGKERICLGIARALGSKIFAPPAKMRICRCLEDEELNSLLTDNPLDAQVHMQTLMEIRADTLHDYLVTYKGRFSRVVGFRPTGWSYRPPTSRFTENPAVSTVLHSEGWKSRFTMRDLAPQRGSTTESNCFGVPYSEHSSFRELTMFCCALRIGRVIPTVNVGSAKSREKMKGWIEKWEAEKKKNGLYKVEVGADGWGSGDGQLRYGV